MQLKMYVNCDETAVNCEFLRDIIQQNLVELKQEHAVLMVMDVLKVLILENNIHV